MSTGYRVRSFTAAVSFDNGSFERSLFQFRNFQFRFPCGCVEILLIMTGTISMAVRGTLMLFSVEFIVFLIEQGV